MNLIICENNNSICLAKIQDIQGKRHKITEIPLLGTHSLNIILSKTDQLNTFAAFANSGFMNNQSFCTIQWDLLSDKAHLNFEGYYFPEFQIRGGIEDNSEITFVISQRKHML